MLKLFKREARNAVGFVERVVHKVQRSPYAKTEAQHARIQDTNVVNDEVNRNDLNTMTTTD